MSPLFYRPTAALRPRFRFLTLGFLPLAILLVVGGSFAFAPGLAQAQPKGKKARRAAKKKDNRKGKEKPIAKVKERKNKKGGKDQTFDFTGLSLGGSVRTPQLLYFLDRASEELKRASLERRSFIPEMILSISEEGL
ncbi:MAG: hypothetical protein JKY56_09880 [Kofleriaceae bacterium]|nr:hypothetical protein [Kofleriaceae bacterium]